jgi:hypothetical protein
VRLRENLIIGLSIPGDDDGDAPPGRDKSGPYAPPIITRKDAGSIIGVY